MENQKQIGLIAIITGLIFAILGLIKFQRDDESGAEIAVMIVGGVYLIVLGANFGFRKTTNTQQA